MVTGRSLAVKIADNVSKASVEATKALHSVIRSACHMQMSVHVYVDIQELGGLASQTIQKIRGKTTEHACLLDELVRIALGIWNLSSCGICWWKSVLGGIQEILYTSSVDLR